MLRSRIVIPVALTALWRERAALLRQHGASEAAATLDTVADELEMSLRAEAGDVLTLTEASAASGFSRDHLARLLRAGTIPNMGRPHAPRIRRADLPRKPQRPLPSAAGNGTLASARRRMAATVVHSEPGD
jgi:hypothetical protein